MEPQGVHVNFVPVPRAGADDQVNLMLTAGTAPDIIRTYDRQRVATYGSQGGLVDLGPYLERMDCLLYTSPLYGKRLFLIPTCRLSQLFRRLIIGKRQ